MLILRSIRWRDVLAPLPINHAPNMSQADIVRPYAEAAETAQPHDVEDDDRGIGIPDNGDAKPESASHLHRAAVTKPVEKSTRRALTTEGVASRSLTVRGSPSGRSFATASMSCRISPPVLLSARHRPRHSGPPMWASSLTNVLAGGRSDSSSSNGICARMVR